MKPKRRYADGDLVREGQNENIGDDTRARAMEFLRKLRNSGEAAPSTDTSEFEVKRAAPKAAPAPAPAPAPAARKEAPAPAPRTAKAEAPSAGRAASEGGYGDVPSYSRSMPKNEPMSFEGRLRNAFPGNGPEDSLPALMPGLPAVARGIGRFAGGLASAAKRGWKAGEAEKAATRREAKYSRDEQSRMEGEGPVRTKPAARPKSVNKSDRERSAAEEAMQNEGGRYAKGGKVTRGDGIAKRGKTRGRIY